MRNSIVKLPFSLFLPLRFLLVFACWGTVFCRGQQVITDTFSTLTSPDEITDFSFLDSTHGWMAIADHNHNRTYIVRTTDGGGSWQKINCPFGLTKLFFVSHERGWALERVTDSKLNQTSIHLLATTDGGQRWSELSERPLVGSIEQTHEVIVAMAFMDDLHGWFVGGGPRNTGFILQTNDGGKSFQRIDRAISAPLGVTAGTSTGVLIFGMGFVLRSADMGKNWESPVTPEKLGVNPDAFFVFSSKFIPDGHGWLVGQAKYGIILDSQDFGKTWQIAFKDERHYTLFQDIWRVNSKQLCAVGNTTFFFCSMDGGSTWGSRDVLPPRQAAGQSPGFFKLVLLESGRGWVVREGGYLYETDDGGGTWKEHDPLEH
jgi:photosystem II stability/assembly factor-like uncharacterized protein